MKVAFDTNVLLDAIAHRDGYEASQELIMKVARNELDGVISANSITDIYYIARKTIGDGPARNAIWNLMTVFDVASVTAETCEVALSTPMSDFEDAVLAVCAATNGVNYVVSRDRDFQNDKGCPVRVLSPIDLLEMIEGL